MSVLKRVGSIVLRFFDLTIKKAEEIEQQSKKASHRPLGPEWDARVERQIAIAEYKHARGQRGPETWRR